MDFFIDKLSERTAAQEMIRANGEAEAEELESLKNQVREYGQYLGRMQEVSGQLQEVSTGLQNVNVQMNRVVDDTIGEQIEELMHDTLTPQIMRLVDSGVTRLENVQVDTDQIGTLVGSHIERLVDNGVAKLENAKVDTSEINRLVEESIRKIQAIQEDSQAMDELKRTMDELRTLVDARVSGDLGEQLAGTLEQTLNEKLGDKQEDSIHKECVKVYRNVQAVVVEESGKQADAISAANKSLSGKLGAVLGISIGALVLSFLGIVFQILTFLNVL